jgi:hypothetical protein
VYTCTGKHDRTNVTAVRQARDETFRKPQSQANENPIVEVGARKCYLNKRFLDLRFYTRSRTVLLKKGSAPWSYTYSTTEMRILKMP